METVNLGAAANDGTGDPIRTAFGKINTNFGRSAAKRALVIFGDSLAKQAHDGSASSQGNCYVGPRNGFGFFQAVMGHPFYCPGGFRSGASDPYGYNMGVGGDTTDTMLSRLQTDVLDKRPDAVYFLGGTNDLNAGTAYATVTGRLASLFSAIQDNGALLLVETIPPRAAGQWGSANYNLAHCAVNEWIRDYCTNNNAVLIDPEAYVVDRASGDAKSGYVLADGVHYTPLASWYRGQEWVERLSGLVTPMSRSFNPDDVYDGTYNPYGNIVSNGEFAGTGGTISTGDDATYPSSAVATSWRAERASGSTLTFTASKGTVQWGGNTIDTQDMILRAHGTGPSDDFEQFRLRTTSSTVTTGLVTGAYYKASCWLNVAASSGGNALHGGTYMQIADTTDSPNLTVRSLASYLDTSPSPVEPKAWANVDMGWVSIETPVIKLRGTTGLTVRILSDIIASVTDTMKIRVHSFKLHRIPTPPPYLD